jgi:hypothetical protein
VDHTRSPSCFRTRTGRALFAFAITVLTGCATARTVPKSPPKTLLEVVAKSSPLKEVTHQRAQADGDLPDPPLTPAAPDSPPGSSDRYEAIAGGILYECDHPPNNVVPQMPEAAKVALRRRIKIARYVVELYFEPDGRQAALFPQETPQQADADRAVLGTLRNWRSCPTGGRVHTRLTFDYDVR